jgi:hypothetical protein
MEWKHSSSPRTKKLKCAPFHQSDVDTILGLHWAHPQALLGSWTHSQYCDMLEEGLKRTVRSKHREMLTNGLVLHPDNAQCYMAVNDHCFILQLQFEVHPHPA